MATVQLARGVRFKLPNAGAWPLVVVVTLFCVIAWPFIELWRVTTWPKTQFDLDDSPPRDKVLVMAIVGLILWCALALVLYLSITTHWQYWMLVFSFGFLYAGLTFIRFIIAGEED